MAGIHHVAFATKDVNATIHFYEDLFGFPLIHSEAERHESEHGVHSMTHLFFDAGADASIAFFTLDNIGEQPEWKTDLAESVGVPVWVNHCAFRATSEQQTLVKGRMASEGIEPLMDLDHGWCHSLYFLDPNGIMVELCRDTPGFTRDGDAARKALAEAHGIVIAGVAGSDGGAA